MKLNIQLFAVPDHRVSKSRKAKRNSHKALTAPGLVACPSCKEMIKPHRVCSNCGSYKGSVKLEQNKTE